MKKLLFLLLGLAVSASAIANFTLTKMSDVNKVQKFSAKTTKTLDVRGDGIVVKGKAMQQLNNRPFMMPSRATSMVWDLEDTTQLAGWAIIDADGDGNYWGYMDTILTAHSGVGVFYSASYINNQGALTPDNWLISPEVTLGGGLELYARGQDASYPAEVFAIYVAVGNPESTDDFIKVTPDFTATGEYVRYSVDLSAYEGQTGCFAIRHYNVTDQFILLVDDIAIGNDIQGEHYEVTPTATTPRNLAVEPAATEANVTWDDTDDASWNLRYRPYVDVSGNPINMTLPNDDEVLDAQLAGISILDADGDGKNWGLYYTDDAHTDCAFSSASYDGGACTPDNWLIMPLHALEGIIKFKAWNYNNSYPEMLQVMIGMEDAVAGTTVYTDQFTTIESYTLDSASPKEYTIDISSYNGQKGYVVFRHTGTTDMWRMYLDDIFIGDPNAEVVEEAEWIYVNGLANTNYNITGLTPATEYQVQVMAYNESSESAWTSIVNFTTLAEDENNVYILGEVNDYDWAPNDGLKMTYDEENDVYTATVTLDGRGESGENYFSFTTKLAADENDWDGIAPYRFGAVSVGDFWYSDDMDGQPLSLTYEDGQAFRVMAGEYKLTLNLTNMTLTINNLNPAPHVLLGDVNNDGEVGIADVSVLIDHLLSGDFAAADDFNPLNADVDQGGDIGIGDVSALIDLLLNS